MKYGVLLSSVMVLALVTLTGCPKTEPAKSAPPVITTAPGESAPFEMPTPDSGKSATSSASTATSPTVYKAPTTTKATSSVPSTSAARPKTYKVKSRDTLEKIAKRYYKNEDLAKAVAAIKKANDITDANKIKIGQELKLPDLK